MPKFSNYPEVDSMGENDYFLIDTTPITPNSTSKITYGNAISTIIGGNARVYNIGNYGAVADGYTGALNLQTYNSSATDNTNAIASAISAITSSATGVGILYIPEGCFMTDTITLPQGVTIRGAGRGLSGLVLKPSTATGTLIISYDFSTYAGQQFGSYNGPNYFEITDCFLDGNAGNVTYISGQSDYRNQPAIIKLYAWHFSLKNLDLRGAKENGIYTEYVNNWSNSFNYYQFAESVFENIFVKEYGSAGWCNRGPHDSMMKEVFLSAYPASDGEAVTPYVGYIQQSYNTTGTYYSAAGMVCLGLHVWGQHTTNAVYLDQSNIIEGWIYAEGSDQANVKLVNSSGNKFRVELGYSNLTGTAPGVELYGASNYNYIEAKVESNVNGGTFQLDTTASYNHLAVTGGYNRSTGALFDLTTGGTYSGLKNTFVPNTTFTGAIFLGTPNILDTIENSNNFYNVKDFGAQGDNATDDTTFIQAAINACPQDGIVYLPHGQYRTSTPLVLLRGVTLRGSYGARWRYAITPTSYIKPLGTFSGAAVVIMYDQAQAGYAAVSGGQRIENLTIDCSAQTSGTTDGIQASGLVEDVRIQNVSVSYCRGKGIHTILYVNGSTNDYAKGWELTHVVCDTGFDNGFAFNSLTDSVLIDCLAVSNAVNGFYLAGMGEDQFTNCRAVFNKNNGFLITGTTFGNTVFNGCSTDRNEYNGVSIVTAGNYPIAFSGLVLRRDGRNGNSGGGSYAGLNLTSATTPVIVDNLQIVPGIDDSGSGTNSPQYGISSTSSTLTVNSGYIWGATTALNNSTNTVFIINPLIQLATGIAGSQTIVSAGGTQTTGYVLTANGANTSPTWRIPSVSASFPASSSATGVTDTIATDGSYIYICTATNTWKRVAIATF